MTNIEKITYGDLFSGISCPVIGLKQLGYEVDYKFACDIDKDCQKFLKDNHNPEILYNDVTDIKELPHVQVMVMGFPCQPFSSINNIIATDEHKSKDLYQECIRCIKLSKPELFIMENVKGLTFKSNKSYFDRVLEGLNSLEDYCYDYKILDSSHYGIPQSRKRIWFIGKKIGSQINFPTKVPLKYTLNDILDLNLPLREQVGLHIFEKENGLYITNGQTIGKFTRYHKLPFDWSYCVLTKRTNYVFKIENGKVYCRPYSNSEICKLFGLEEEIIENPNKLAHFLGNGMDVTLVAKLIVLNL